jgi:hypothetical protein
MQIKMTDDTAQGVYWELNSILKPDWTITNQENGFRIGPAPGSVRTERSDIELLGEVWRISSFVAYQKFASISKTEQGYVMVSQRENGTGFLLIFDSAPNGLPNHRPIPASDE